MKPTQLEIVSSGLVVGLAIIGIVASLGMLIGLLLGIPTIFFGAAKWSILLGLIGTAVGMVWKVEN